MRRPRPLPWTICELLSLLGEDSLLELLTTIAGQEQSVPSVARRLDLPEADVHHRLHTLCMYGLVCYDRRHPGRYRLSEAVMPVFERHATRLSLVTTNDEHIVLRLQHATVRR